MQNNIPKEWNECYLKDVSFVNLMTRRIFNVLIVANPYDAFMLEDDGRVDEKIFDEYTELGLRYPPTFTQVSTTDEARRVLQTTSIDLVICMPGTADNDAFDVARQVKQMRPDVACVVLTPFSHGITRRMQDEDLSIFDYVFCWLGNTNLILSIIKLIEDQMNLEHDTSEAGVQMILLVEDSIRFYSSILPNLYNYILQQSKRFSTEALNPHAAAQRKRGRPKVVLARNYEEALAYFEKYPDNVHGVISDTRFPMHGMALDEGGRGLAAAPNGVLTEADPEAGLKLLREIRRRNPYVPVVLQSSESDNAAKAQAEGFHFIDKNSKKFNVDLRQVLEEHFGFGDFIFRDPATHQEVKRISSLKDLQDSIFDIPEASFVYHIRRNHISRWLCARAIFPVSQFLKNISWSQAQDAQAHRQVIFDAIVQYRRMKNIGVVAVFDRLKFDRYAHFARIGDGSLGGKGRGLAFLDNILKRHPDLGQWDDVSVSIPKTVVLCTDFFDEFMDKNNLWGIALSDAPNEVILQHFLHAQLPDSLIADFLTFIDVVKCPIAVRSSSLLEDSHYQPFAGIYATYMIPYIDDRFEMLRMLACAIKGVYASVYYADSKAYMTATQNVIDQEKMAVILQEVVGRQHGDYYYPSFSGVLRSLNYYPTGDEKTEEGIASLALGLGKYIVDGGQTLRVSPYHPQQVMQTSVVHLALSETQTHFMALDMKRLSTAFQVDDGFNIRKLPVKQADEDRALWGIGSTFDPYNQIIRDSIYEGGYKLITFAGVLRHDVMPLPELLQMVQRYGAEEMRRPVEVEFACNLNNPGQRGGQFYLLQIRPIVDAKNMLSTDLNTLPDEQCLLRAHHSLGHGVTEDVFDVVYVKADEHYDPLQNATVAAEVEQMNKRLVEQQRPYILIGPGRWGSSIPSLGIPVRWANISGARCIVEAGLPSYRIDPSQGSHFFQNLTSFGVGYFTINTYINQGIYRKDVLDAMAAENETEHVRHVRFSRPLCLMMDGKRQAGVVLYNHS